MIIINNTIRKTENEWVCYLSDCSIPAAAQEIADVTQIYTSSPDDSYELVRRLLSTSFKEITYQRYLEDVYVWKAVKKRSVEVHNSPELDVLKRYYALEVKSQMSKYFNEHDLCNRYIPTVYALFGAVMLIAACIFTTLLITGLITKIFLMNPMYNLLICVGSIGMVITVIIATVDWRKKCSAKADER